MQRKKDQRSAIFRTLRSILRKYRPPLVARSNYGSRYELWSQKDVVIAGRPRKEVFFAALIIQNTYVGFYYMPVYVKKDIRKFFRMELLSTLKGKSCFHIKELDPVLTKQIADVLKRGLKLYRQRGWV